MDQDPTRGTGPFRGTLECLGFLLVQIEAPTPGASGTVVVDIRKSGGGSARALRASVSHAAGVAHNAITMPHCAGEEYLIQIENHGESAPLLTIRRIPFSNA